MRSVLIGNAKHNQSRVLFRRVVADVAEIEVERNDGALLSAAHVANVSFAVTTKSFIIDGACIMSLGTKRYCDVLVQVFVHFEPHQTVSGVKGITVSRANSAA